MDFVIETIAKLRLELAQIEYEIRLTERLGRNRRGAAANADGNRDMTSTRTLGLVTGGEQSTSGKVHTGGQPIRNSKNEPSNGTRPVKTVLILKAGPQVVKAMRLMRGGYRLVEAGAAEEALQLFIDHAQQVRLLIANVKLANGSGINLALILRAKVRRLPVILICEDPPDAWSRRDAADLKRLGSKHVVLLQEPLQDMMLSDAVSKLMETETSAKTLAGRAAP